MISGLLFGVGCQPDCQGVFTFNYENAGELGVKALAKVENNWARWSHRSGLIRFEPSAIEHKQCHVTFLYGQEIDYSEDGKKIDLYGLTNTSNNFVLQEVHGDDMEKVAEVLSHEIGHTLGLGHVEGDGSIMSTTTGTGLASWTELDKQECLSVGVCINKD